MNFNVPQKTLDQLQMEGSYMVTEIDHATIISIINWILSNRPERKNFTLLINSDGGSPTMIAYFCSFLGTLSKDVRIKGVAFGECGSAALALLQCCHERVCVRSCSFFIHRLRQKYVLTRNTDYRRDIQPRVEEIIELEDELVRLQCKRSGLSRAKWMKLADDGERIQSKGIMPPMMKSLGLIDTIVDHYKVF